MNGVPIMVTGHKSSYHTDQSPVVSSVGGTDSPLSTHNLAWFLLSFGSQGYQVYTHRIDFPFKLDMVYQVPTIMTRCLKCSLFCSILSTVILYAMMVAPNLEDVSMK